MIQRFRFGLPLPTDSVVQEIPVSAGPVPFLTAEEDGWAYRMAPDAIVYGLGEISNVTVILTRPAESEVDCI